MVFWLFAIAITIIVCATLYYAAAGRPVNALSPAGPDALEAHHRSQLAEIEADIAAGHLGAAEGVTAKAELARELLRLKNEEKVPPQGLRVGKYVLPGAALGVGVIALVTYGFIGNPSLPSVPFAGRPEAKVEAQAAKLDLPAAIKEIEARLTRTPDDLRGWTVIAPVYMKLQRYTDAAHAFRRILALSPPTAKAQTDLAEALILGNGAEAATEAMNLLKRALASDPKNVRARYYLAGEETGAGNFKDAVDQWRALIALGADNASWMANARAGLAAAEAGLAGKPLPRTKPLPETNGLAGVDPGQAQMINAMVEKLSTRLTRDGGSLADWTRLVRSRLVLKDQSGAQKAYDMARKAYPDAGDRADLDALAAGSGLRIDGANR